VTKSKTKIQKITLYDFEVIHLHFIARHKYLITYQPVRFPDQHDFIMT